MWRVDVADSREGVILYLEVWERANNPRRKKLACYYEPRTWTDSLEQPEQRKMGVDVAQD
jgi:hypothetical protein